MPLDELISSSGFHYYSQWGGLPPGGAQALRLSVNAVLFPRLCRCGAVCSASVGAVTFVCTFYRTKFARWPPLWLRLYDVSYKILALAGSAVTFVRFIVLSVRDGRQNVRDRYP